MCTAVVVVVADPRVDLPSQLAWRGFAPRNDHRVSATLCEALTRLQNVMPSRLLEHRAFHCRKCCSGLPPGRSVGHLGSVRCVRTGPFDGGWALEEKAHEPHNERAAALGVLREMPHPGSVPLANMQIGIGPSSSPRRACRGGIATRSRRCVFFFSFLFFLFSSKTDRT